MKIVLAEDRGGKLQGERAFTSELVLVGRDPAVCHYFFAQDQWPMVSRKHAEFRLSEGRCLVVDANSRFGTFVNGGKISAPVEVRVGSHVQLGAGGPILRVVSIEKTPTAKAEPPPSEVGPQVTLRLPVSKLPAAPQSPPVVPPSPIASGARAERGFQASAPAASRGGTAHLELIDDTTRQVKRIELKGEVTRIGRDPEGEVVIDVAAAVVSRRHAEIRKDGEQVSITDLKSFSGTLVNGQRITGAVTLFGGDQIQLGVGGPELRLIDPAHPAPAHRVIQPGAPSPSQPLIPS